jgi:hypothetical protein
MSISTSISISINLSMSHSILNISTSHSHTSYTIKLMIYDSLSTHLSISQIIPPSIVMSILIIITPSHN